MLAGRTISAQDTPDSEHVAVVNQAFSRKYIPGGNPLGRHLSAGDAFKAPGFLIVGVVKDAKYSSPREPAEPMLFLPAFQMQSALILGYVNEIEVRTDRPYIDSLVRFFRMREKRR